MTLCIAQFFKICVHVVYTNHFRRQFMFYILIMNEQDLVRDHKSNQGYFFVEKIALCSKFYTQIIKGQLILFQVACTSGIVILHLILVLFQISDEKQSFKKCLVLHFVKPNKFEFISNLFMSFCMIFSYVPYFGMIKNIVYFFNLQII